MLSKNGKGIVMKNVLQVHGAALLRTGLLACLFLAAAGPATVAQTFSLPDGRRGSWRPGVDVGVPGGIDRFLPGGANARTRLIDVTRAPYNVDNSGVDDAARGINMAIAAAKAGDVVYLPAGTYRTDVTLTIDRRSQITLRGAGSGRTIIKPSGGQIVIYVGSAPDYKWMSGYDYAAWQTKPKVLGSLRRGDTVVPVADPSQFTAGSFVKLSIENYLPDSISADEVIVMSPNPTRRLRTQMCRVAAVGPGGAITVEPPLHFDMPESLDPRAFRGSERASYVGVEGIGIVNATNSYATRMSQAHACWWYDVKVKDVPNRHLYIRDSIRCEVRKCWLEERTLDGPNGAGLLFEGNSCCLVEDNVISGVSSHVQINFGCSGNMFGYNFFHDSVLQNTYGPSMKGNHGPHNSFNLFEGNICPNYQDDGYFGSSSESVLYRNWFHGVNPQNKGYMVNLNRFSRCYTVVGNVLGWPNRNDGGFRFGYPNMGNSSFNGTAQPTRGDWWADYPRSTGVSGYQERDLDVEATTVMHDNHLVSGSQGGLDSGSGLVLPPSLARSSKPGWFGSLDWPPVDPGAPSFKEDAIPAGYRFTRGGDPAGVVSVGSNPPTAHSETHSSGKGMPVTFSLVGVDVDGDEIQYSVVSNPAHGTLAGEAPALVYTPAADFVGSDHMTFRVTDGEFDSDVATVWFVIGDPAAALGLSFGAGDGQISAPFEVVGGVVSQSVVTTQPDRGGRAAYRFAVGEAGDYVVSMEVDAPGDGADSLFVNVDGEPTTPRMIWAIRPWTDGFQRLTVSWLGEGTTTQPEFRPARFGLSAGEHTLVIRGREAGVRFRSIVITPFVPPDEPAYKEGTPKPTGDAPYVPREKPGG